MRNVNCPSLNSIIYKCETDSHTKAVTFTLDIPLEVEEKFEPIRDPLTIQNSQLEFSNVQPITGAVTNSLNQSDGSEKNRQARDTTQKSKDRKHSRYVSELKLDIETDNETASVRSSESSVRIKAVSPVVYRRVDDSPDDVDVNQSTLPDCRLDLSFLRNQNIENGKQLEINQNVKTTKESILQRNKSKEALAAARSQTADWLLSQKLGHGAILSNSNSSPWGSTPDLKIRSQFTPPNKSRHNRIRKESNHSFDVLLHEDDAESHEKQIPGSSYMEQRSFDSGSPITGYEKFESTNCNTSYKSPPKENTISTNQRPALKYIHGSSACSSLDESIESSRPSLVGSSAGVSEDYVNYLRLARLVNGPSPLMV